LRIRGIGLNVWCYLSPGPLIPGLTRPGYDASLLGGPASGKIKLIIDFNPVLAYGYKYTSYFSHFKGSPNTIDEVQCFS